MLLSDAAAGLLPDWAFFVRCVIDADGLRPTASREALYEDETLAVVRDSLGDRIRDWLARLAGEDPRRLAAFLGVHALGVKALARHDHELLRIMLAVPAVRDHRRPVTLAEFARNHPTVYLAPTVEEFRRSRRSRPRRASASSTAATPTTASWSRCCRESCPG